MLSILVPSAAPRHPLRSTLAKPIALMRPCLRTATTSVFATGLPLTAVAAAPVYFDVGGLFQFAALWLAILFISFFIKPRALTVTVAILWPIPYVAGSLLLEDMQTKRTIASDAERSEAAYQKLSSACKTIPENKINHRIQTDRAVAVRYLIPADNNNNENLMYSNRCWNAETNESCSTEGRTGSCWMLGIGCGSPNISALEISYGPNSAITSIPVPTTKHFEPQNTIQEFSTPFELRYIKKEELVPFYLSRFEVQLVNNTTGDVLSSGAVLAYRGAENYLPRPDPRLNHPSRFCPDRDAVVAALLNETFNIVRDDRPQTR